MLRPSRGVRSLSDNVMPHFDQLLHQPTVRRPLIARSEGNLFVMLRTVISVCALLTLSAAPLAAQEVTVRVRVIRPDSQPIAAVQVRTDSIRARTDANGEARLVVPAGPRRLFFTRIGYAPDSVDFSGPDSLLTVEIGRAHV